jgi:1-acyl-sn-glycerol-3-phosphate acyltransferase
MYFGFLAKKELTDNPAMRIFFGTTDIEVDRESGERSALSYRKSVQALQSGKSIVIFAEGGIFGDPRRLNEFKDGAFQMAIRLKVPILPMTMPDNWKVLPDGKKLAKPGKIRLILHEAVDIAGLTLADMQSLKDQVYKTIENDLKP